MQARSASGLRLGWLTSLAARYSSSFLSSLSASDLGDTARQLAHKIATATGPGAVALDITNRSSLDDKSVREVRSALEAQLRVEGVRTCQGRPGDGIGRRSFSPRACANTCGRPKSPSAPTRSASLSSRCRGRNPATHSRCGACPIALKKNFSLRAGTADPRRCARRHVAEEPRLLVLDSTSQVAVYRQQVGRWELETSLPIAHSRTFPRDLRGRLLLRRDHLFDVYLPGTILPIQRQRAAHSHLH